MIVLIPIVRAARQYQVLAGVTAAPRAKHMHACMYGAGCMAVWEYGVVHRLWPVLVVADFVDRVGS